MRRIIVGITGASGSIYGYMLLRALRDSKDVETHLVLSNQAMRTVELETDKSREDFESLADAVHDDGDLAAPISSGSFITDGMAVLPCSTRSASAIAHSFNTNLLVRAADVCLKERRKVVLGVRETPLHLGHLRTLVELAETGAIILPLVPAMYTKPKTIEDIVQQAVAKTLDLLGVSHDLAKRWSGPSTGS
ncbi:MAG: UbiX family flavin prenyltransferase [Candidatus Eremiobacteraeota bacterium]|nr:UbiX family flavin prenyltransferase [Candidatus Eremiobacteraeota bacterium]